jgi:hypothetical protein
MGVDGVRSAGVAPQQTTAASFQAKDALQGGSYKLTPDQTSLFHQAKDIYGKEFPEKYTKPAIEETEQKVTEWIKEHPTADQAALDAAVDKISADALTKQQGKKIGDDFFLKQIAAKMAEAVRFNMDSFEE